MSRLWAIVAGMLFGAGLVLSGMTDPAKVLGFLDLAGVWDPSLMLVMGGALAVYLPLAQWRLRQSGPDWCGTRLEWPKAKAVSARLVVGAGLFGIGWGLAGICPGPALANLAAPPLALLWFIGPMLVGLWLGPKLWQPGH